MANINVKLDKKAKNIVAKTADIGGDTPTPTPSTGFQIINIEDLKEYIGERHINVEKLKTFLASKDPNYAEKASVNIPSIIEVNYNHLSVFIHNISWYSGGDLNDHLNAYKEIIEQFTVESALDMDMWLVGSNSDSGSAEYNFNNVFPLFLAITFIDNGSISHISLTQLSMNLSSLSNGTNSIDPGLNSSQ